MADLHALPRAQLVAEIVRDCEASFSQGLDNVLHPCETLIEPTAYRKTLVYLHSRYEYGSPGNNEGRRF